MPYLAEPDFERAVSAWARAEASVLLLAEWIGARGMLDAEGHPWPAVDALLKFERLAADHRSWLGLDPSSRAKLERELADAARGRFDVERLVAEGRQALAARGEAVR